MMPWVCSPVESSAFLSATRERAALNWSALVGAFPVRLASRASNDQYSTGLKAMISRSRSATIRRAADWTRPAERPRLTFFHRSGLTP
jgi:hypothetical protein